MWVAILMGEKTRSCVLAGYVRYPYGRSISYLYMSSKLARMEHEKAINFWIIFAPGGGHIELETVFKPISLDVPSGGKTRSCLHTGHGRCMMAQYDFFGPMSSDLASAHKQKASKSQIIF